MSLRGFCLSLVGNKRPLAPSTGWVIAAVGFPELTEPCLALLLPLISGKVQMSQLMPTLPAPCGCMPLEQPSCQGSGFGVSRSNSLMMCLVHTGCRVSDANCYLSSCRHQHSTQHVCSYSRHSLLLQIPRIRIGLGCVHLLYPVSSFRSDKSHGSHLWGTQFMDYVNQITVLALLSHCYFRSIVLHCAVQFSRGHVMCDTRIDWMQKQR